MRKVIVTGGRDYADVAQVDHVLRLLRPTCVVQGGASGADALARWWACENGVNVITYQADWHKHGRAAGPIRNQLMLEANLDAYAVVAFPGGRGTTDCVRKATKWGLQIIQVTSFGELLYKKQKGNTE